MLESRRLRFTTLGILFRPQFMNTYTRSRAFEILTDDIYIYITYIFNTDRKIRERFDFEFRLPGGVAIIPFYKFDSDVFFEFSAKRLLVGARPL